MFFSCYFCNNKKKLFSCNECHKIVCNDCKSFSFHKHINKCIFCKEKKIKCKYSIINHNENNRR